MAAFASRPNDLSTSGSEDSTQRRANTSVTAAFVFTVPLWDYFRNRILALGCE